VRGGGRLQPFTLEDGSTVDVYTMNGTNQHQSGQSIPVAFEEGYTAFCLSTDGTVDVWVALPDAGRTPEDVVRQLAAGGGISDLYTGAHAHGELHIYLPRFEFSYRTDDALMTNLETMGIQSLFGPSAELQGIAALLRDRSRSANTRPSGMMEDQAPDGPLY
jgi:hypothetical protein